jgi:hypothetical protein
MRLSFLYKQLSGCLLESIPEKTEKGNPKVAFFGEIRNKSKIREIEEIILSMKLHKNHNHKNHNMAFLSRILALG